MAIYKLRLQTAFYEEPIIVDNGSDFTYVEVADLDISDELVKEIQVWDKEYQGTFNAEYPPDSCFDTPQLRLRHEQKGLELAKKLQNELGDSYVVEYK